MSAHHHRMAPALIIFAALAIDAASAQKLSICAEHNRVANELVLTMSNGCISSSMRYIGHDLEASVDQHRASINVSGNFNYKPPLGNIGTTDCMNAKQFTITVPDTEARRYFVSHNGEYDGIVDLTSETGQVCSKTSANAGNVVLPYHDWQSVDVAGWGPKNASSLMEVIAPITSGHPESTEGRPMLKIEMTPWFGRDAMLVQVTMTGYLDDSVSGEKYVALVEPDGNGWVLRKLWKQNLCARGGHAGQWTASLCP